jgi:hypothetical protein
VRGAIRGVTQRQESERVRECERERGEWIVKHSTTSDTREYTQTKPPKTLGTWERCSQSPSSLWRVRVKIQSEDKERHNFVALCTHIYCASVMFSTARSALSVLCTVHRTLWIVSCLLCAIVCSVLRTVGCAMMNYSRLDVSNK